MALVFLAPLQGRTALHIAAAEGHSDVAAVLLEAGASPMVMDATGSLPIHLAAATGRLAAARLLLEAAPQAAGSQTGDNRRLTPLHVAVAEGQLEMVRLLVELAPHAALIQNESACMPINTAAANPHLHCSAAMVQLLLNAAPTSISSPNVGAGANIPLILAAICGNAAAARLLVRAEPNGAWLALKAALAFAPDAAAGTAPGDVQAYVNTARALLQTVQPAEALPLLVARGDLALPLFPDLTAHWPLTAAQWQEVPSPCPGLGHALPAVLQRSEEEAALLVAHLPPADSARLQTFALALHRSQRSLSIHLPSELVRRLLSLFDC